MVINMMRDQLKRANDGHIQYTLIVAMLSSLLFLWISGFVFTNKIAEGFFVYPFVILVTAVMSARYEKLQREKTKIMMTILIEHEEYKVALDKLQQSNVSNSKRLLLTSKMLSLEKEMLYWSSK